MQRLGIEEGEHIESGMVTRAVENAQKKVEAMHFESRKHILEYDDVANQQRQVVYAFRNDLLEPTYDIDTKINENIHDYAVNTLANAGFIEGMPVEDYDFDKVLAVIHEELRLIVKKEGFEADNLADIETNLTNLLIAAYDKKMSIAPAEQKSDIAKMLYLRILDDSYREHLYSMDTLKTGIGLRGYNQKDPLVEYKKESYHLFMELRENIKLEIVKILFTIQLVDEEEEKRQLEELKHNMQEETEHIQLSSEEEIETKFEKKVARNEPCPCGSGKKYKQCCGKSGPKKGLLAQ
jgi:preprotein translocase subunit SecA